MGSACDFVFIGSDRPLDRDRAGRAQTNDLQRRNARNCSVNDPQCKLTDDCYRLNSTERNERSESEHRRCVIHRRSVLRQVCQRAGAAARCAKRQETIENVGTGRGFHVPMAEHVKFRRCAILHARTVWLGLRGGTLLPVHGHLNRLLEFHRHAASHGRLVPPLASRCHQDRIVHRVK